MRRKLGEKFTVWASHRKSRVLFKPGDKGVTWSIHAALVFTKSSVTS
jgi:hypothetical protein